MKLLYGTIWLHAWNHMEFHVVLNAGRQKGVSYENETMSCEPVHLAAAIRVQNISFGFSGIL